MNRKEQIDGVSQFEVVVTQVGTGHEVLRAFCRGGIVSMVKEDEDIDPKFGKEGRAAAFGQQHYIHAAARCFILWYPQAIGHIKDLFSNKV